MDRFLSKRQTLEQRASQPPCKKPKPAAKQGKVLALVHVAEFGADKFFADNGKFFCCSCNIVIEHTRKNTVERLYKIDKVSHHQWSCVYHDDHKI